MQLKTLIRLNWTADYKKIPHLIEIAAKDFHPEFYRFQLHILLHAAFTLVRDNVIGCIQIYMKTDGH